ncbi:MAG: hypothetical protein ACTSW1_19220 [Candidatus Hodarchaeales archaeon]
MGLIESIVPLIKSFYVLLLIVLIYFGIRAVYSHFQKEIELIDSNNYRKGPTKYNEPPRPLSPKFKRFVSLASLTGQTRQRELVKILSQSLKKQISKTSCELLFSKDICNLIEDPNKWINNFYSEIGSSKRNDSEYTSRKLFTRIMEILEEVSTKLTLNIETSNEWKES